MERLPSKKKNHLLDRAPKPDEAQAIVGFDLDKAGSQSIKDKLFQYVVATTTIMASQGNDSCDNDSSSTSSGASFKRRTPIAMMAVADFVSKHAFPYKSSKDNRETAIALTEASLSKLGTLGELVAPNQIYVQVPSRRSDSELPNPWYHSVEHTRLYIVMWELFFPKLRLSCTAPNCEGTLQWDRHNLSKHRHLFPLFRFDSPPDWCIVMKYKCGACKASINANDGRLLQSLPPHVRALYPVYPKYATQRMATYHIHQNIADFLEDETLLTYQNGDVFSRLLYSSINKEYLRRVENYASLIKFLKECGAVSNDVHHNS
jgi:hypothetical protein